MPRKPKGPRPSLGGEVGRIDASRRRAETAVGFDEAILEQLGEKTGLKIAGITFNIAALASWPITAFFWQPVLSWLVEWLHRLGLFQGPPYWTGEVAVGSSAMQGWAIGGAVGALIVLGVLVPKGFGRQWLWIGWAFFVYPVPFAIMGVWSELATGSEGTIKVPAEMLRPGVYWEKPGLGQLFMVALVVYLLTIGIPLLLSAIWPRKKV